MTATLTARNATAQDLVSILTDQQARKVDVVVPATKMRSKDGVLHVSGAEAVLDDDGVTTVDGRYRPTEIFDEGASSKLEIPRQFLRRMRETRPDLYDANFNGLLHGKWSRTGNPEAWDDPYKGRQLYPADDRAFLLRLFRGDEGGEGVARAMLSDRYGITMDNLDILTAVMKGITDSGHQPLVRVTDLSERNMRVRFEFPDVNTLAPGLLDGYNSPFDGRGVRRAGAFDELRQQYGAHHIFEDKDAPIVILGFDLRNSETGGGAYVLNPVAEMIKCTNGWVMVKEGIRRVHLGARLEQGLIKASARTAKKAGQLVASETQDAVSQWLDGDGFLKGLVAGLEAKAGKRLDSPTETVPAVCQSLGFSEDERKGVLDLFILSGQPTAGGLANAVSAYAQTVADPDRAYEIELATVPALDAASAA